MARYENGVETREKIIAACRKLFYEKGYAQTTFLDICKEAHVNQGSIYYHFREKAELYRVVEQQENQRNLEAARKFLPKDVPAYLELAFDIYIYWCHFFTDEGYRRFVTTPSPLPYAQLSDYQHYWNHLAAFIPNFDAFYQAHMLDFTVCSGLDEQLTYYLADHLGEHSPELIAEYEIRTFLCIFQLDKSIIESILKDVRRILQSAAPLTEALSNQTK